MAWEEASPLSQTQYSNGDDSYLRDIVCKQLFGLPELRKQLQKDIQVNHEEMYKEKPRPLGIFLAVQVPGISRGACKLARTPTVNKQTKKTRLGNPAKIILFCIHSFAYLYFHNSFEFTSSILRNASISPFRI